MIDEMEIYNQEAQTLVVEAKWFLQSGDTERAADMAKIGLLAQKQAIACYFRLDAQQRKDLQPLLATMYMAAAYLASLAVDPQQTILYARMCKSAGADAQMIAALDGVIAVAETVIADERKKAAVAAQPKDAFYARFGFTKVPDLNTGVGEYMPGIPDPRQTQAVHPRQRAADTYLKEAQASGLDTKAWIAYYNHLADLTGMTAVIDVSDTDVELNNVRSAALKLLRMGVANIAALNDLVKAWKGENGWRKGGITPAMLVEYQSKVATAAKLAQEAQQDAGSEMLNVEIAVRLPDGTLYWQPAQMTRAAMEQRQQSGFKLRVMDGGDK